MGSRFNVRHSQPLAPKMTQCPDHLMAQRLNALQRDLRHANHRISRHKLREFGLTHVLGP